MWGCSGSCPSGWVVNDNSCYLFSNGRPLDFYEAQVYCQSHGVHLVTVETSLENRFLKDYLSRLAYKGYWMGSTDEMVEGVWRWLGSDAIVSFKDWYPGEPNDARGEDCGYFESDFGNKWNDDVCTRVHYPLCERSKTNTEIVG